MDARADGGTLDEAASPESGTSDSGRDQEAPDAPEDHGNGDANDGGDDGGNGGDGGDAGDDGGNGGDDGGTDASAPIAFIQVAAATPAGSTATASVTFADAQSAGDLIVLVISSGGSGAIARVSDSVGNGYAAAVGPTHISAGIAQSIYYAKGIASAPAGTNVVTVTMAAPTMPLDVSAAEYAGLDPVSPLDMSAGYGGRNTSATSGPVTIGTSRELVFGAGVTLGSFTGAGSAFTLRKLTGAGLGVVEDRVVSSTGSYSADAPLASSASFVMQVAAFR
jgi:hypothetical protein